MKPFVCIVLAVLLVSLADADEYKHRTAEEMCKSDDGKQLRTT
jgi:hypothetical protein